jgi:hypothetical protein
LAPPQETLAPNGEPLGLLALPVILQESAVDHYPAEITAGLALQASEIARLLRRGAVLDACAYFARSVH